jgi:UDP-N-acetylmuramate--alanine ligase
MRTHHLYGRHVHFIGIGGIGMSALARILLSRGSRVSGSDSGKNYLTEELDMQGATCFQGHRSEHVEGADLVVYSPAVPRSNCELKTAREKNIPVLCRAQLLKLLAREKDCVGIAGTHGKSTTSWLVGSMLLEAGFDPTLLVGANIAALGSNCHSGNGRYLVAEVDESDGVFADMRTSLAVVTNIGHDHHDYYKGIEETEEHFLRYLDHSVAGLGAIVCADNANALRTARRSRARILTYGTGDCMLRAHNIHITGQGSQFEVEWLGTSLGQFRTPLLGRHNILNSLAAIGAGIRLDVPVPVMAMALEKNHGVDRRLTLRGEANGIRVWDDYGHHPVEMCATLQALRPAVEGRLHVVFQPHRFSRTFHLYKEFGKGLRLADHAIVTGIYAASEKPIDGVSSKLIVDEAARYEGCEVEHMADKQFVPQRLAQLVKPGDGILLLGAGDIHQLAEPVLEAFDSTTQTERSAG